MKKYQRFQDIIAKSAFSLTITLLVLSRSASGAGVTILTHGFQLTDKDSVVWLSVMGTDLHDVWLDPASTTPEDNLVVIKVDESLFGVLTATIEKWPSNLNGSELAEIVVVLNWSSAAGIFEPSDPNEVPTQEQSKLITSTTTVALEVVNLFTESQFGFPPLVELPIHLIGHSRGGSLVSELARLFGERGIWVDQMTTLDPHPWILSFDADPLVYENILFADNYYQDNFNIFVPDGRPISGAYNRLLGQTELAEGGYSSQHSDIHLWYHGTVDKRYSIDIGDGEEVLTTSLRSTWYEPDEFRGTMTGYRFSRLAESFEGSIRTSDFTPEFGGDQVNSGYSELMDGVGARSPLDKSSATWPNLIRFDVFRDGVTLGAGDWYVPVGGALGLRFWSVSYNDPWIEDFFLDTDRNPYNGFASETPIISTGLRPSAVSPLKLSVGLITSGIAPSDSGYYFCGRIRDISGQHVRYLYASPKIIFFEPPSTPTDTIQATDTYVDTFNPDINFCSSNTLLAGSGLARIALMHFDLSGVSESFVTARFHLWVNDFVPAPTTLALHQISRPVLDQCQITRRDDIFIETQEIATRPFSVRGWNEIDITNQVRDWASGNDPNLGFVITAYPENVGGLVVFGSAESAHPPFLVIDTTSCCATSGDANNDNRTNIADVTFLISWLFAGGESPACCAEGNANGDDKNNIADVSYIIAWLFGGGPDPICGPTDIGC